MSSQNIRCPLCGNPLVPVGKKGVKMKCERCRSVFDVSQLRSYYGMDTPSEAGMVAHEYETPHMHQAEMAKARQKAMQQSSVNRPDPSPIQSGNIITNTTQQFQQQIRPPAGQYQQAPIAKKNNYSGMVIFIIVLFFFILPFCFNVLLPTLYSGNGNSGSNSNRNANYNVTNYNSNTAFNKNANSNRNSNVTSNSNTASNINSSIPATTPGSPISPSSNITSTATWAQDPITKDYVVIFKIPWTNPFKYDASWAGSIQSAAFIDGVEMREAYPDASTGYNSDSRYNSIAPGETATVTVAYRFPENFADHAENYHDILFRAASYEDINNTKYRNADFHPYEATFSVAELGNHEPGLYIEGH